MKRDISAAILNGILERGKKETQDGGGKKLITYISAEKS